MDDMDRNILTLRLFHGVRTGNGNRNLVREAIEDGADVDAKDSDGCTALLLACKGGVDDVIDLLIHAGADVEARDNHGDTGLSLAIRNRHTECAKLLVMAGANVNVEFAFADGREFWMMPNNLKKNGWTKDPDAYLKRVERFVARELAAGSSLPRAAAKPGAVAPDIRAAHSDTFLSPVKRPALAAASLSANLAEHVKEFQSAQTHSTPKSRAPT